VSLGKTVTVIEPTAGHVRPRLAEAWRNRDLFWFLTLRDIKARYVQTRLGWVWTVAQPFGMMLVFAFAFGRIGNVQSDGVAYSVFALVGVGFWTVFGRALQTAADSLAANAPLLTKTPCPRLLMPLAAVAATLLDLAIVFILLLVFSVAFGYYPTWHLLLAPAALSLGMLFVTGLGLLLSTFNVRYRDVRNALPLLIPLFLLLSPIAYSLSTLGPQAQAVLAINPLVGIIEAFRWTILPTPPPSALALGLSVFISVGLTLLALVLFSRFSRDFADVA
jgi:lipopolysaccharide transport system permease protein